MKHIKKYKIFESENKVYEYDDIHHTLMQYFQDFKDEDDYNEWDLLFYKWAYVVQIHRNWKDYGEYVDDIKLKTGFIPIIERAIKWMETKGYSCDLKFYGYWSGKHTPQNITLDQITEFELAHQDYFELAFKKDGDLKLLESLEENYDIYDFFEELKDYSYTSKVFNKDRVKDLSNRFIGDGIFERVVKLVDSIFNSLEEVNIEDIEEGMLDIFDEYHDVDRRVMLCVFHSDLEDIKKFNATLGIGSKDWPNLDGSKPRIICNILRDMIYPTLFIGYPSIRLRFQNVEQLVKDKKYLMLMIIL